MRVSSTETAWFSLLVGHCVSAADSPHACNFGRYRYNQLRMMHLALAIGLITVAIPIRLEGHSITIGWLVEVGGVAMGRGTPEVRSAKRFCDRSPSIRCVAAAFLGQLSPPSTLLFNERMGIYVIAIAVLGYAAYKTPDHEDEVRRKIAATAL